MTVTSFDPYRAERHVRWRNRIAAWRDERAQTVFHAAAIGALVGLLVVVAAHSLGDVGPLVNDALTRWPVLATVSALTVMTVRQSTSLARLRHRDTDHWLRAQPVAHAAVAQRQRDDVVSGAAVHLAIGLSVLAGSRATAMAAAVFVAAALAAAWFASPLSQYLQGHRRRRAHLDSRWQDAGVGRLWRWQRIETGVALRGRSLAFGLWALLLIPMGSGPIIVLAVGGAGFVLAMLATAWQRSVGVLPEAQAWLAAQPLSSARLLRATSVIPASIVALSILLLVALLMALGVPAMALAGALGIVAFAALQFGCVAAERARPRRIAILMVMQSVLLIAMLQAMPMLAPLSWMLQMFWLLRRAVRP